LNITAGGTSSNHCTLRFLGSSGNSVSTDITSEAGIPSTLCSPNNEGKVPFAYMGQSAPTLIKQLPTNISSSDLACCKPQLCTHNGEQWGIINTMGTV